MTPRAKSGVRTPNKIEANNCPLRSTCACTGDDKKTDDWLFCGYFAGSHGVNKEMLVVRCQFPIPV